MFLLRRSAFLFLLLIWLSWFLCAVARAQPEASVAPSPPALMLANVYQRGIDVRAYWVSEKLDGVRAYWDGQRLISRGGRVFLTPEGFTSGWPSFPLDGELWMGRGAFEQVSGVVRRQAPDPAQWREIHFMVFDLPGSPQPFGERLKLLRRLFETHRMTHAELIAQRRVDSHEGLMALLEQVVAAGGEGLMLHRDDALYRATRSDDLLKLKQFQDAEARVIAHLPGRGKYAGMMGALLVEDEQGRRFRIGTGFSDAQRRDPPPPGSRITFRYTGLTSTGVPRFASFLRVRPAED